MGMIALPQRHLVQPQYAAPVDWSHPALQNVSASIIVQGGAANWTRNQGRLIAAPTLSGTAATTVTKLGQALNFNAVDTVADFGVSNIPYTEFTLLFGGVMNSIASFRGLIDCTVSGVSGWNVFQAATDTLWFSINGYSGQLSSSGWPTGKFVHGALRNKYLTSAEWFRDGAMVATGFGQQPVTPTVSLKIGTHRAGGTAAWDGSLAYLYLFDKFLPNQLIADIARNPWQIFKAPARRIYIASSSSSGAGSASGTSTVSGVGASVNAQPGTSAGTSTASGVGASTAASVGSASGSASVSGTGAADANSVGSSSGVATVSGVGTSSTGSSGSAAGTSTASGVGSSVAESVGSSSGVGTVSGVGSSIAESSGSSSGSASVSGVGDYSAAGSSVGTASGTSTVSGVGASVVSAVGTSSGTSSVLGVSDSGSPEREAGGDDYPLIVREKRRKKTLAEQPNKHLESIFEKAVKDVLGEKSAHAPSLKEIIELGKKEPVSAPATKPDSNSVEFDVIKDDEAKKVAALLAQYQEQVRLAGMHEDEELMILLMEAF